MVRTCYIPGRNVRFDSLGKSNSKSGSGVGAVLLDGGLGGQSSYTSIDAYERATNRNIEGYGLEDKIGNTLSRLNINIPSSRRNIKF